MLYQALTFAFLCQSCQNMRKPCDPHRLGKAAAESQALPWDYATVTALTPRLLGPYGDR